MYSNPETQQVVHSLTTICSSIPIMQTLQGTTQQLFIDSSDDGVAPPDVIIHCLKAITPDVLSSLGMREFYKSYPIWQKMTIYQHNRAIAWFHQLPEEIQDRFLYTFFCFSLLIITHNLFYFLIFRKCNNGCH
jgi:hypothetical protein